MTAVDSLMMNGGYNSFSDPAWQQYWAMSQQMNAQNYAQQLAAVQNTQGNALTFTGAGDAITTNTNIGQGAIARAEEPKKGGNRAAIALTATAAVGGTALWIASRGKAAGATGFWNQLSAGFKSFGKASKNATNSVQIRNVNGQNIISLPEKARGLNVRTGGSYTNSVQLEQEAQRLGLQFNPGLQLADDAAKLNSTRFTFKFGSGKAAKEYEGIYRQGKIVGLKDTKGNKVALDTVPEKLQKQLDDIANTLSSTKKAPTGVTLKDTTYIQSIEGGEAMFVANSSAGKNGLRVVRTNRYKMNDDVVTAARSDAKLNQFIKEYEAGNFENWNITEGIWKPSKSKSFWEKIGLAKSSEYKGAIHTDLRWDDNIALVVKNNEVIGLTRDGGKTIFAKPGNSQFDSLKAEFPQIFKDVLSHNKDFTGNIVRTMA